MPYISTSNAARLAQVFTNPNVFTSTLIVALIDLYGTEVLTWSPQTILMELEDDCGIKIPDLVFDRLMAGVILLTTDRFYKSLPDFIELANIMSGSPATPGVFMPADADDCAWGITEALLLAPPDDNDAEPFSEEIRGYVGEILKGEGIINPPDILRIANIDPETVSRVHSNFSDDPVMSEAVFGMEMSKTDDINDMTKERLGQLIEQLSALQLEDGSVENIAAKMMSRLAGKPQEGTPLTAPAASEFITL